MLVSSGSDYSGRPVTKLLALFVHVFLRVSTHTRPLTHQLWQEHCHLCQFPHNEKPATNNIAQEKLLNNFMVNRLTEGMKILKVFFFKKRQHYSSTTVISVMDQMILTNLEDKNN